MRSWSIKHEIYTQGPGPDTSQSNITLIISQTREHHSNKYQYGETNLFYNDKTTFLSAKLKIMAVRDAGPNTTFLWKFGQAVNTFSLYVSIFECK